MKGSSATRGMKNLFENASSQSLILTIKRRAFRTDGIAGANQLLEDVVACFGEIKLECLALDADPIFIGVISNNPWKLLSNRHIDRYSSIMRQDKLWGVKENFALLLACGWPMNQMPENWLAIAKQDATCRGIIRTIESKNQPYLNKSAFRLVSQAYSTEGLAYVDPADFPFLNYTSKDSLWFVKYFDVCTAYKLIPANRIGYMREVSDSCRNYVKQANLPSD